ncbi:hypothetical protein F0562_023488 [Nyssa sinensis]|uniref:Uncharacterized protein n=1 Tax=Nyssa sinensis TaxID=561372 RepID=A0A5J5BKM8_9ASTE|nr:hypothetical protein F0562_023488 [Nyssa sinensis]
MTPSLGAFPIVGWERAKCDTVFLFCESSEEWNYDPVIDRYPDGEDQHGEDNVRCCWDVEICVAKVSIALKGLEDNIVHYLNRSNRVENACNPYGNHSQQAFHFFHLLDATELPWIGCRSVCVDFVLKGYDSCLV